MTLEWLYGSMDVFDMTSNIRFGWTFIGTVFAQKWFKLFMDGGNVDFELAASGSFVSTAFVRTLKISNFVMHCFYVSNETFSSCKRLRALITQKWFDLKDENKYHVTLC